MTASDGRLRITYVIKEMITGGSQTHLVQVLRLLDRTRFEPRLICLSGKGELLDAVRASSVPVQAPGAGLGFDGVGLCRRIAAMTSCLRAQPVDIVHNYLLRANVLGSIAARLRGALLCRRVETVFGRMHAEVPNRRRQFDRLRLAAFQIEDPGLVGEAVVVVVHGAVEQVAP